MLWLFSLVKHFEAVELALLNHEENGAGISLNNNIFALLEVSLGHRTHHDFLLLPIKRIKHE